MYVSQFGLLHWIRLWN